MDARQVALAALGGGQAGGAADGEEFRGDAAALKLGEQIVEAEAVAADDDEIGERADRGRSAALRPARPLR